MVAMGRIVALMGWLYIIISIGRSLNLTVAVVPQIVKTGH